jgi:hypothetical protein
MGTHHHTTMVGEKDLLSLPPLSSPSSDVATHPMRMAPTSV